MGKIPSALTRREFIALGGGVAAVALIVGADIAAHGSPVPEAKTPGLIAGGDAAQAPAPDGSGPHEAETADRISIALSDLPWNLRLVNRDHPLPDDFAAPERAEIPNTDGQTIDARILDDLAALLDAAGAAGVRPVVCSAYRTSGYQQRLFEARVRRAEQEEGLTGQDAEQAAAFWVARPGTSEHEAALAVDLADASYQELDEGQEGTPAQRWLMEHCAEYGFILRYPTDKSAVTGIGYEPWHYRYVGKEAASDIAESGLCFEEWLVERYNIQG